MNLPAYPKTKPSGVEWLGDVPEHWEVRRLKFAAPLINDKLDAQGSDLPYMGLEHVESWTGRRIPDADAASDGVATHFLSGDVLFGKLRPYLAKVYLADCEGVSSTELLVLRSEEKVCPEFLRYYTVSRDFINAVDASTYGAKMPRANWEFIGNLSFLIPSPDEQKAIAEFLDRKTGQIDELIGKKKELIKKLTEQRSALITAAVTGKIPEIGSRRTKVGSRRTEVRGRKSTVRMTDSGLSWLGEVPEHWDIQKLKFNVSKVGSGVTPSGGASSYQLEGIPLLRSQNIHFDGLRLDDVAYIDEDVHESMSNSKVFAGDVLLNITGASIGRCNFFDGSLGEANVNQHVCIIRPESGLLTRYLHYFLWSDIGQLQIQLEQSGSGREGLNFAVLKNFLLPITDKDEQQRIIDYLDEKTGKIDGLIKKTEAAIQTLEEYRTALITAAVTGKVKVG